MALLTRSSTRRPSLPKLLLECSALAQARVFSMTETLNLDIVDQVVQRIPEHTWLIVREALVTNIVDAMPSDIMLRLFDNAEAFDEAETFLNNYYDLPKRKHDLIVDAFKILGQESVLFLLDSLQLDKVQPTEND